jgi:hypothetical protein
VVLGRHVDRLKFLEVMLGNQPALTPPELLYQRMLAGDPVEATEQARLYLEEESLFAYYDDILVKALKLAQADAERNRLNDETLRRIRDVVSEILDDLREHQDDPERKAATTLADQAPAGLEKLEAAANKQCVADRWRTGSPILCVPAAGLLDEALALVIAELLERRGIRARTEQADALSIGRVFTLDTTGIAIICLCSIELPSAAQIRYAVRRLRRLAPDVIIVVALLENGGETQQPEKNMHIARGSLRDVTNKLVAIANEGDSPPSSG